MPGPAACSLHVPSMGGPPQGVIFGLRSPAGTGSRQRPSHHEMDTGKQDQADGARRVRRTSSDTG